MRKALAGRGNVPFPEERNDLIVISLGVTRMVNDSGIGGLLDSCLGNPLSLIFDISFALSSAFSATSAEWELEITLRG